MCSRPSVPSVHRTNGALQYGQRNQSFMSSCVTAVANSALLLLELRNQDLRKKSSALAADPKKKI